MGQKVNPISNRLGFIKGWDSNWFGGDNYGDKLVEDQKIRNFIKKRLAHAGISRIEIERTASNIKLIIHTARPGIVIGKKGSEIEMLKKKLGKLLDQPVLLDIVEVRRPEVDAQLVAENVANQLVRRIAFRRAMKKAVGVALRFGAQGIRIACSGRLGGAEMSRREWYLKGRVPLHTLRADIDYGLAEAYTTYGVIGVKVWIFKGEVLEEKDLEVSV
jgi:small subunit ribosomal protein S3